ncbi:uncharacterized protein [Nicotiana tomentosiformis]|uniref:uncharacterized protein isoform X2 n=1 Tax=Nicotiana tomentosiformis TaxID=4098 RepID=UPI00051C68FA|nr:uncharacterized protein LOC104112895 isoform X2 [Nicotiana tomentosiformis]
MCNYAHGQLLRNAVIPQFGVGFVIVSFERSMQSQPPPPSPPESSLSIASDSPPENKQKLNEGDGDGDKGSLSIASDLPREKKQKLSEGDGDGDGDKGQSGDLSAESDSDCEIQEDTIATPVMKYYLEGICPCCNQNVDKALWQRYRQQIKESQGFDIKDEDCPSGCSMVTIWPMTGYLKNPENVKELKDYAQKALDTYNAREGAKYVVGKILKVNGSGCRDFHFYITLTVKTSDGEKLYFQAKVVRSLEGSLDFPVVRPRAKGDKDIW